MQEKHSKLEIDYKIHESISYCLKSFSFINQQDFMPPKKEFYDLLNSQEKNSVALIWFSCILKKHGIALKPLNRHNGKAGYRFCYDEISVRLYKNESDSGFEFYVADIDKCEKIAEALRDIIVKEGRGISYNDWIDKKIDIE